ncbi:ATP-binding protein [Sulfurovum sp. bin170]|uniref:ATP-binding protein n=1 Tax=Sulfurovum sp. bin170 TaxID=2695268 RepID=UPI0013E0D8FF|nr:ATP-binding protein [Sulfurovum sp. bin170]NEW61649.1 ATP-binding protein [Sulfurovum sp. bin170]
MKKLPIGISTLKEILEKDMLYIDKTKMALDLIDGKYFFLSRPRRFGKSLFLNTLHEIFKGNKELFKGLYIYDKYNFTSYPVIKISFGGDLRSADAIKTHLLATLEYNQQQLQIECKRDENFAIFFQELIQETSKKYNQKVVVLIDEYDKAILDNVDQMSVAIEAKEILKSFYSVMKENDRYLRFVFLTGVTKFAKVSIFSGLNNLEDITLYKRYATICGYTQDDLDTSFKKHLEGSDREKVKTWYNGYNFNGEHVYNPFDILLFIRNEFTYRDYWFATGTPSFLIKLMQQKNYFLPQLENLKSDAKLIDSFSLENMALEPILFQAGYLTIDKIVENEFETLDYYLRVPNKEVAVSLNTTIITFLTDNTNPLELRTKLFRALNSANFELLEETLISLFASIPYNNYVKNTIGDYEGYYASVIYAYLSSFGLKIVAEDVTNLGRIDLTITVHDRIYILEFKVGKEDALAQIKAKKYHQKYLSEEKEIYLLGINFDDKVRNISVLAWERV